MVALGLMILSLGVELIGWLFPRRRPERILNEVLFFPSKIACVEYVFNPSSFNSCICLLPHGIETSFSRLLCYILSASSSLDLCVFAFSNMHLRRAVLILRRRGVAIRVICDKDYVSISGSQIGALRSAGICVRFDRVSAYMHHKFAVLDGRLLLTGSLNWTLAAVQNNCENVLITEDPDLVRPFIREFQRLWVRNGSSPWPKRPRYSAYIY